MSKIGTKNVLFTFTIFFESPYLFFVASWIQEITKNSKCITSLNTFASVSMYCFCYYPTGTFHRKFFRCVNMFVLHKYALYTCLSPSCCLVSSNSTDRASSLKTPPNMLPFPANVTCGPC